MMQETSSSTEKKGNVEFVRDSMVTSFKNSVDFLLTSDFGQEDTN